MGCLDYLFRNTVCSSASMVFSQFGEKRRKENGTKDTITSYAKFCV